MELISGILGNIKNVLSLDLRQILISAACVAIFAWSVLLLPEGVFEFLHLDDLRTNNLEKIGGLAFTATSIFVLGTFYKSVVWASNKFQTRRRKTEVRDTFRSLGPNELLCLYQFIWNRTTLIEFDETDPVVGLLCDKGLIYPSMRVRIGTPVRYRSSYDYGQPFNISSSVYDYLAKHPELFATITAKRIEKNDPPPVSQTGS